MLSTVTPAEATASGAPGMWLPAGSSSVNRARVNAAVRSKASHGRGTYCNTHSTPVRCEGRLASVVPASPTNRSSESCRRRHSASVVVNPGRRRLRRPASYPVVRTSGSTRCTGSLVFGSTVIVVPRASLLWKPCPQLRKYSVFDHGPKISESLGESIPSLVSPEFSGMSLDTSKR